MPKPVSTISTSLDDDSTQNKKLLSNLADSDVGNILETNFPAFMFACSV